MNKLKYLRLKNNLKQKDLCNLLKITQPNYSNFENGKIKLNLDYAIILSKFYDVTLDYLLKDDVDYIQIKKEDFKILQQAKEIIEKISKF